MQLAKRFVSILFRSPYPVKQPRGSNNGRNEQAYRESSESSSDNSSGNLSTLSSLGVVVMPPNAFNAALKDAFVISSRAPRINFAKTSDE